MSLKHRINFLLATVRKSGSVVLVLMVVGLVVFMLGDAMPQTARYATFVRLAGDVRVQGEISDNKLAAAQAYLTPIIEQHICRSDILKAGVRLLLLDLDRKAATQTADERKEALGFAETYMRHGISCLPQDGDVWLRLAMIRQLQNSFPEEVATLANMSQMMAPADPDVLEARFALWKILPPDTLALTVSARTADVNLLCSKKGAGVRRNVADVCAKKSR